MAESIAEILPDACVSPDRVRLAIGRAVEPRARIELATYALRMRCSTD